MLPEDGEVVLQSNTAAHASPFAVKRIGDWPKKRKTGDVITTDMGVYHRKISVSFA